MTPETVADILIYTLPVVTAGLTVVLAAGADFIRRKFQSQLLTRAVDVLDRTVSDVVGELNRTVVAELKKARTDGKLTPDEAMQIKNKAVDLVMARLGRSFTFILQQAFGSVIGLIGTKIEATVFDHKKTVRVNEKMKSSSWMPKAV